VISARRKRRAEITQAKRKKCTFCTFFALFVRTFWSKSSSSLALLTKKAQLALIPGVSSLRPETPGISANYTFCTENCTPLCSFYTVGSRTVSSCAKNCRVMSNFVRNSTCSLHQTSVVKHFLVKNEKFQFWNFSKFLKNFQNRPPHFWGPQKWGPLKRGDPKNRDSPQKEENFSSFPKKRKKRKKVSPLIRPFAALFGQKSA